MYRFLWPLFAVVLNLPAQAATECRDIRDHDLRRMCNALERGDSGDYDDIDSRDLWRYCSMPLTPGQRYDCDDVRDGDTRRQCRAIVRGDRKRYDDIDSRDMRRQCRAVVSRAPWQCDDIDDRDIRRICRVILSR